MKLNYIHGAPLQSNVTYATEYRIQKSQIPDTKRPDIRANHHPIREDVDSRTVKVGEAEHIIMAH